MEIFYEEMSGETFFTLYSPLRSRKHDYYKKFQIGILM